ncbi:MAG: tetratricopeptide repeat protein, partial [Bacteroidetes bacterium]|nr:tetratricopeptide repeat protein [Bacteroidota bacterium]
YFNKSLQKINELDDKQLQNRDLVEYYYRKARIYDELDKKVEANTNYILVMNKSIGFDYYFAANSSLKLAQYFEQNNKKSLAIKYYNKAIALPKDEYENSINAEAKAGLNRVQ